MGAPGDSQPNLNPDEINAELEKAAAEDQSDIDAVASTEGIDVADLESSLGDEDTTSQPTETDEQKKQREKDEKEAQEKQRLLEKKEEFEKKLEEFNAKSADSTSKLVTAFRELSKVYRELRGLLALSSAPDKAFTERFNESKNYLDRKIAGHVNAELRSTNLVTLNSLKSDFASWRDVSLTDHTDRIDATIEQLQKDEKEKSEKERLKKDVDSLAANINTGDLSLVKSKLDELRNVSLVDSNFVNAQIDRLQGAVFTKLTIEIGQKTEALDVIEKRLGSALTLGVITDAQFGTLNTSLESWRTSDKEGKEKSKEERKKSLIGQARRREIDIKELRNELRKEGFSQDEIDNLAGEVEPEARSYKSNLEGGLSGQIDRVKAMVYEPKYVGMNTDQIMGELKKEYPDLSSEQLDVLRGKVAEEIADRRSLKMRAESKPLSTSSPESRISRMANEVRNSSLPTEIKLIFEQDLEAYQDILGQLQREADGLASSDQVSQEIATKQIELYKAQLAELQVGELEKTLKHAGAWMKAAGPGALLIVGGTVIFAAGGGLGLAAGVGAAGIVGGGVLMGLKLQYGKELKQAQTEVKQIELDVLNKKKEFRGEIDAQEKQKRLDKTKESKKKLSMRVQELKLKAHKFVAEKGGDLDDVHQNMLKLAGLANMDTLLADLEEYGNVALGKVV